MVPAPNYKNPGQYMTEYRFPEQSHHANTDSVISERDTVDTSTRQRKIAKLAAWSTLSLVIGLAGLASVLFFLNRATPLPPSWGFAGGPRAGIGLFLTYLGGLLLYGLLCAGTGALVIVQRPRNSIGWLLSGAGLAVILTVLTQEYTILANFTAPHRWPGATWAALAMGTVWIFIFWLLLWLLALFPNGRLPSSRWRWVLWLIHFFMISMLGASLSEDPLSSGFYLPNPLPVAWPDWLYPLFFRLSMAAMLLACLSVLFLAVTRFRRSRGVEWQQFKWLAMAALLMNVVILMGLAFWMNAQIKVGQVMLNYSAIFLPLGIGVAILRYRLYDIDVIIRRTLIYGLLTAALALVYFGSIVLLQSVFSAITGRQQSEIITVLSTLTMAVLFTPLHRRIQATIDRRFYRGKYDAAQTLAAFAAAARDEVELERLTVELLRVVQETMQPEQISLWLKPAALPQGSDKRAIGNHDYSV